MSPPGRPKDECRSAQHEGSPVSLHAPATLRGERVTLRPWCDDDLAPFAAMNADLEVMRHFPAPLSREQSDAFAQRARLHIEQFGHGLWALQRALRRHVLYAADAPVGTP